LARQPLLLGRLRIVLNLTERLVTSDRHDHVCAASGIGEPGRCQLA